MEKKVIEEKKASYFAERMKLLGVTEKLNRVDIYYHDQEKNGNVLKPVPVFREVEKGIEIFVYTLARGAIKYAREEGRWKNKDYSIIRLKDPIVKPNRATRQRVNKNLNPFFHLPEHRHRLQYVSVLLLVMIIDINPVQLLRNTKQLHPLSEIACFFLLDNFLLHKLFHKS